MKTLSLRRRLLLAAAAILITFLGLAGFALDRAFISSAKVSLKNQLRTQTFALLSVIEVNQNGELLLPAQLPDARLMVPNSGLNAVIINYQNKILWQSPSSIGVDLGRLEKELRGSETFTQLGDTLHSPFRYSFSISWETEDGSEYEFTLILIETSNHFATFVDEHRGKIILWLGLVAVFLLFMQMLALNWSLSPLARVSAELDQIERSEKDRIIGNYPSEIAQLSQRINQFIANERKNLERYRNTLGDLAHSLKTPLAVVRGLAESDKPVDPQELEHYVDRMGNIVEYQLQRAATSRVSVISSMIDVGDIMLRIRDSLDKVYAEKSLKCDGTGVQALQFYGDQADIYELVGNLMDNAYKWGVSVVRISNWRALPDSTGSGGIGITIEDDGPGVDEQVKPRVMQRGVRADQRVEGQGIGLAVSMEIIERYDGSLEIERSDLGGAKVSVILRSAVQG